MKGNTKANKGIVLCMLGAIIVIFVGILVVKSQNQPPVQVGEKYTPTEQQINLLQGQDIKIPLVSNILIGAEQEEAEVCFFNPESNTYNLTYTLYVDDEMVFQSEEVAPGYAILNIKLNQSVPVGKHTAMVEIKSYDMETGKMAYGQKQVISIDVLDAKENSNENT